LRLPSSVLSIVAAVLLAAVCAGPDAAAERRVPPGWLGVVADGPLSAADAAEWDGMVAAGAESVRTAVFWHRLQPYGTAAEVPPADAPRFRDAAGIPTDFSALDATIAAAAARRLRVLLVVQGKPGWAARTPGDPASPPARPATFAAFLRTLVARYGPQGSLWVERPDLPRTPIRAWQIWNEPNLTRYWSAQPFAKPYVRLLRAAHAAVADADPGATVVVAGLPNESWTALRRIYAAGGRGHFDAVALHPYTGRPRDVLRLVRRARRVMARYGDARVPVWLTELSWPAARGKVPDPAGFEVTEAGQAARLATALRLLAGARERLRIGAVFWYTWLSTEAGPSAFDWSGLRRLRGNAIVSAQALATFRRWARRLEGCPKAPGNARRCRT
jgi:hypothetical protein